MISFVKNNFKFGLNKLIIVIAENVKCYSAVAIPERVTFNFYHFNGKIGDAQP